MLKKKNNYIAIFIPTLRIGGAEKQAVLLAKNFAQEGYSVLLLFFGGWGSMAFPFQEKLKGIPNVIIPDLIGNRLINLLKIAKLMYNYKVKVLFNFLTFSDFFGSLLGQLIGVEKIYSGIRTTRLHWTKIVFEYITHSLFSNGTIFNSFAGRDYFCNMLFSHKKSFIIQNCFENIENIYIRESSKNLSIVTIGRFVPEKDYICALNVIELLIQSGYANFHFNIVGYGKLESVILDEIKLKKLDNYVTIHNPPHNPSKVLNDGDIYLSTSIFEGTSNSIMEAMNATLPIVATNVGDNKQLIHHGRGGYLTEIGDISGIVKKLIYLIENYEVRVEFGKYNNNLLRENFSSYIFLHEYINLL